jgi:hypothetical protein
MCFNASRFVQLATAISAAAGLGICGVRADEKKGEPAESLGSRSGNVTTNSSSFKPKQNGLKQLEQDLFRPFETLAPKGSLDGAFVPSMPAPQPAAPSVQSKRANELLERRRDWVFETPEEILAGPSSDDKLNRRDQEKESDYKLKLSPLERFYDRLYNKEKKGPTQKGNKRGELSDSRKSGILSDDSEADDDADLPLGIRETQREMKKLLAPKDRKEDSSTEPGRGGFSDIFGLGKNTRSHEEIEMQKERMDRYKELVGLPVAPRQETDPLKQFRDMVGISPKGPGLSPTMNTLGGLPQQNIFGAQSGSAAVTPNASLLPEGAIIHTTPSLAPALPKIEPPKTLPPPVTFGAPRRAF